MLLRSSSNNRKILETEGSDASTMTTSCDSSVTPVASDCVGLASAELNPLQNPVILCNLFDLCPVNVLATCRLVCKQWNEESQLIWRKSFPLRFTYENGNIFMKHEKPRVNGDVQTDLLPLETFLEYVADPTHQCQAKPYRSIQIKNFMIDKDIEKKKKFDVFWNALGSNLTSLELVRCAFPHEDELRRIIFNNCPKLERLIIDWCKFSKTRKVSDKLDTLDYKEQNKNLKVFKIVLYMEEDGKLPISWLELFNHFPLISSFSSTGPDTKMPIEDFCSLTKAIRIIRKRDENLLPFKVFDVGAIDISADPSNMERLSILQDLCLPIRGLFVVAEPGIDESFFRDTFAFCAKTLKDLCLTGWIQTPSFSEFPFGHQLDNLTHLSMGGKDFPKYFTLLKYAPNLEGLDIERDGDAPQKIIISNVDMPEPIHLNMIQLTKLSLDCLLKDEDISKLHAWMPNVTDLMINVNDKQFGIVCEKWRNLKKLNVLGNRLTDKGVIGMKNKKGADITNLQNLEKFRFEGHKLSAVSVFNGFLQLPALRILQQFGKTRVRWGPRTRQAIMDKNIRLGV